MGQNLTTWVESSDFGPKSDDLGHRILKSDLIPSDLAKSDCISRPILFSDRKKSRSSESDRIVNGLRRIIMWIRFRASDFGLVAKIKLSRANRSRLLLRRLCSCHSFFCSCDSAVRLLDSENSANVDCSYVRRRAERTSPGPGLEHPSLRSGSSQAAKRRAEALHVFFFSTKYPSSARAAAVCTLA